MSTKYTKPHYVFLKYFELIKDLKIDTDPAGVLLLSHIGAREAQGFPMTVVEIMNMADIASPTTMHRRLGRLIAADLVEHSYGRRNYRTKYVVLTDKARKHFDRLGAAIQIAGK